MKSTFNSHLHRILLLLLLSAAAAQPPPPENENQYPNYAKFSPSMAIIIVVLIAALFFMGFFSIYIRHCSDSAGGGSVAGLRRALSLRGRRGAASRGLDAAVIDTFPTFTYAEVKDHKIGKSALECAVCLNEFEDHETLRLIPKCDHVFHPECVDVWLESHVTCPVCRANLTEAETGPVQLPEPAPVQIPVEIERIERNASRTGEIAVQIDEASSPVAGFEFPNRPPRSFSVRTTKITGLDKFRSHSTGHSLIQPGENLDRFTLKLPNMVRKEMMDRAVLNRTGSAAATLPRERSSRRGLRTGGESSSRWGFFSRGMSMRATKVVAEAGESSGSAGNGPPPMKMPSFKCLEPKTDDETGLMAEDRNKSSV